MQCHRSVEDRQKDKSGVLIGVDSVQHPRGLIKIRYGYQHDNKKRIERNRKIKPLYTIKYNFIVGTEEKKKLETEVSAVNDLESVALN